MNQMEIFKNPEFGSIRVIEENGKYLFCGTDVAAALGYSNSRDAIIRHCRYAALLYAGYVRKAWTAPGKDRGQHSQSSCDPSKAATLPDQQLLCRIKAAGNAR